MRQKAAQVSFLEDENVKLKNEIRTLKEASREGNQAPNTTSQKAGLRTPLAPKSINQLNSKHLSKDEMKSLTLSELQSEYSRIDKKYAKLHERFLDLHNALNKSNDLLRERTTMYQQWVDHAKELGEQSAKRAQRIKKLEAKLAEICQEPLSLSFSSDGRSVETAAGSTISATNHPHQLKQPNQITIVPSASTSEPSSLTREDEMTLSLPPLPRDRKVTDEGQHIKSEPSSDILVVVSERSVGKRKHISNNGSGMPAPRRVKIESSPELQHIIGLRRLSPHESMDFDTEYRRVETPRKHTRQQQFHDTQVDNGDYNDADTQERDRAGRVMPYSLPGQENGRKSASDASATNPALQSRSSSPPLHKRSHTASNNWNGKSSTPRGLATLAEIDYSVEMITSGKLRTGRGVLEQLLGTPSRQQGIESPHQGPAFHAGQSPNFDFHLPKRRELPFEKGGRNRETSAPNARSNTASHGPTVEPMNKDSNMKAVASRAEKKTTGAALRQIPKSKLRLEDFRINPDVNEGHGYAFTDVIRRKDDRACLQSCVKENCCGSKFRALARASRASTRQDEFQGLLETYLGNNCHQLSTMSQAEKETLWIEAKMRELANTSGRHRHRYPRMSTPPGFWRTDFPSTQEGEEYNEEAAKLEREVIDERYREAMRPGGLWVFRDE